MYSLASLKTCTPSPQYCKYIYSVILLPYRNFSVPFLLFVLCLYKILIALSLISMGLLNFKRKSKKRTIETLESRGLMPGLELDGNLSSNSSSSCEALSISFQSPIADIFMVTSSIPDITANDLLGEILSELPTQDKISHPASDGK